MHVFTGQPCVLLGLRRRRLSPFSTASDSNKHPVRESSVAIEVARQSAKDLWVRSVWRHCSRRRHDGRGGQGRRCHRFTHSSGRRRRCRFDPLGARRFFIRQHRPLWPANVAVVGRMSQRGRFTSDNHSGSWVFPAIKRLFGERGRRMVERMAYVEEDGREKIRHW